jgi:hypothetical protein
MKIFTTAVLMVIMLRRPISLVQWLALFLLFLGISLVQVESMTSATTKQDVNGAYGLLAVIIACKFKEDHQKYIIKSFIFLFRHIQWFSWCLF